jgi:hypothetical protein
LLGVSRSSLSKGQLDTKNVGIYWAYDKSGSEHYKRAWGDHGNDYWLEALIPWSSVDLRETLRLGLHPSARHINEREIRLKQNSPVTLTKINGKKVKQEVMAHATPTWRTLLLAKYKVVSTAVWYHGRSVDSEKFDLSYVGRDEAKDQEGPGFYFTNDKKDAAGYAHPSGVILTVKLTPRKLVSNTEPAPIKDIAYLIDKAPDKENTLMNWDENPAKALKMATKAMMAETAKQTFENIWFDFYRNEPKQFLENLVHLGYDGHYAERTSQHIIIYNPRIIKVIHKEHY